MSSWIELWILVTIRTLFPYQQSHSPLPPPLSTHSSFNNLHQTAQYNSVKAEDEHYSVSYIYFCFLIFEDDSRVKTRAPMQIVATQTTIILLLLRRCRLSILMILIGIILPNVYMDTIVRMSMRTQLDDTPRFAIVVLLSCFFFF